MHTSSRRCSRCRKPIAADNTDKCCSACMPAMLQRSHGPSRVPDGFWGHPDLVAAARERHMGRIVAAYRRHPHHGSPIAQATVGIWAHMSQAQISRYETGAPDRHLDRLLFWAQLLHVPSGLLWFSMPDDHRPAETAAGKHEPDRRQKVDATVALSSGGQPSGGAEYEQHVRIDSVVIDEQSDSVAAEGDEMARQIADAQLRRRSLMVGLTAVASTLFAAQSPRRRIGMTDVTQLNALVALYRGADQQFGGATIADDIGRFAVASGSLLDHEVSDDVQPHLFAAIAAARYLAGWTAFDAIRHTDAHRHFAAAERAALESGDRQLVAYVRYGQAKQLQHQRHNHDALDTLRMAHLRLTDATPGLITALLGAEAASKAAVGDFDGARRALDASTDAFTDVDPTNEPERLGFLNLGEVYAQAGRIYRDWARQDSYRGPQAVRWVADAIRSFDTGSVRSTVLNQVGLASAYFLAGDPDSALRAGHRAQQAAAGIASPRLAERLWNLRRDARPFMDRSDVSDFILGLPRPLPA